MHVCSINKQKKLLFIEIENYLFIIHECVSDITVPLSKRKLALDIIQKAIWKNSKQMRLNALVIAKLFAAIARACENAIRTNINLSMSIFVESVYFYAVGYI